MRTMAVWMNNNVNETIHDATIHSCGILEPFDTNWCQSTRDMWGCEHNMWIVNFNTSHCEWVCVWAWTIQHTFLFGLIYYIFYSFFHTCALLSNNLSFSLLLYRKNVTTTDFGVRFSSLSLKIYQCLYFSPTLFSNVLCLRAVLWIRTVNRFFLPRPFCLPSPQLS